MNPIVILEGVLADVFIEQKKSLRRVSSEFVWEKV